MELQRVVRCAERQLRDGCRNHRPGGCLVLSGRRAGREKYLKETADNVSIYKIPYLFLGGHTIELTEKQKDPYREIVLVQDNSSMEFLPDLKLNDSTGKTIADRAEESLTRYSQPQPPENPSAPSK